MNACLLYFILTTAVLSSVTLGLRITKVLVPKYVNVGDNPKLYCDFDLEDDELNYVMWYKDGIELSKFLPGQLVQTHERRGIMIDKYESTEKTIILKNVTLFSSGLYKCKVASKGNLSKIKETRARAMVVVVPPNKVQIHTSKETYNVGEKLLATCSSYSSNPTALISWKLNSVSISDPQHESGKTLMVIINEFLNGIESRQNVFKGIMYDEFFVGKNASLQLSFQVQEKYIKSGIKIECQAHVGDLYVPASKYIQVTQTSGTRISFTTFIGYIYLSIIVPFIIK
jgi:hypothetical protein